MPKRRYSNILGRRGRRFKSLSQIGASIISIFKQNKKSSIFGGAKITSRDKAIQQARYDKWKSRVNAYAQSIRNRRDSGELKRMATQKRFGGGRLATRPFYGNQHVRVSAGGTTTHRMTKGKR